MSSEQAGGKTAFVYSTDEWAYVGCAIERYFKHLYNVEVNKIKINLDDPSFSTNIHNYNILLTPLFEKSNPFGLQLINRLRIKEANYKILPVFLVSHSKDIPQYFNQHLKMTDGARKVIKNPDFGDIRKAIFLAEIMFEDRKFINLIDLSEEDALPKLKEIILDNKIKPFPECYLKNFYASFINYYEPFNFKEHLTTLNVDQELFRVPSYCNSNESKDHNNSKQLSRYVNAFHNALNKEDKNSIYIFLKIADTIYSELNNFRRFTKKKERGDAHRVHLELFRSPVPFPLQELIHAKNKLKKLDHKVKLLLIDNKPETKKSSLEKIFEKYRIKDKLCIDDKSAEEFNFKDFLEKKNYRDEIYNKVKDAHFILLDFFLDENNTYLAFDFVREICEYKKQKGDYQTTWFFITSAVYDSVVKYSQSGVLAEYYESAVVNSGDDPTNEKREIIFLYKLLTFIQARIENFNHCKNQIESKMFASRLCLNCKDKSEKFNVCLKQIRTYIKRYLTEYETMHSICYATPEEAERYLNIIDLIDILIQYFQWLPDADWRVIQHHIEAINSRLKAIDDSKMFSCSYILEEIKERSDIF